MVLTHYEQNGAAEPRPLFGKFGVIWSGHILSLLGMNLLYLICCVPVVTIPAATCGLHAVVQLYYRERQGYSALRIFFREFRAAFVKRTLIILGLLLVPVLISAGCYYVLSTELWLVASALSMALAAVILGWFVPQLVFLNLTVGQAFKNACIFTCIETKRNFRLLLLAAASLTVMAFGFPLTLLTLVVLPVMYVVLVTLIVMPTLRERLVREDPQPESREE